MALCPPPMNTQQQPPGRPRWYTFPRWIVLRAFEGVWAFYWPNGAWSLIGLVYRSPHGLYVLLNARLVANALFLTYLFPAVWERPLLGWPSFIGLIVLGLSLAHRYGRSISSGSFIGPFRTPQDMTSALEEVQQRVANLRYRVDRVEDALDQLKQREDDPFSESD